LKNDTIPLSKEEQERYKRMRDAQRLDQLFKKAQQKKVDARKQEARKILNDYEIPLQIDQSNQYASLQNEINIVKNQTIKLQSQINELTVNLEIKDKSVKALEKQIQYVQQTNYEMYLTYISSVQQIIDLIHRSPKEIKNNAKEDNVTFEPSSEPVDAVLKMLQDLLQKQGKWEPLYPDLKHLNKQNLDNARTQDD